MKRWYQFIVGGILFFCTSLLFIETFAEELLVKYPPMTKEEMKRMAEDAADFFAQEIKKGRTEEALVEFNKAPRFRLTESSWEKLKKEIGDQNIKQLEFLRDQEFEEYPLTPRLKKIFGKRKAPQIRTIIVKYAEEVFATQWAKGSLADYRFVITYNCEKNIHTSHPTLKYLVNKPMLDRLKDVKGKRYIYELCNKTQLLGKGVWEDAWQPVPGKARSRATRMVEYMIAVKGTPFQVGIISRNLTESVEELNSK